ncbi:MAG: hypothetical protein NTZ05_12435 [Chloroflexi bacterium]|nr:hypothetical protein [Chloroflexota bacterium]
MQRGRTRRNPDTLTDLAQFAVVGGLVYFGVKALQGAAPVASVGAPPLLPSPSQPVERGQPGADVEAWLTLAVKAKLASYWTERPLIAVHAQEYPQRIPVIVMYGQMFAASGPIVGATIALADIAPDDSWKPFEWAVTDQTGSYVIERPLQLDELNGYRVAAVCRDKTDLSRWASETWTIKVIR